VVVRNRRLLWIAFGVATVGLAVVLSPFVSQALPPAQQPVRTPTPRVVMYNGTPITVPTPAYHLIPTAPPAPSIPTPRLPTPLPVPPTMPPITPIVERTAAPECLGSVPATGPWTMYTTPDTDPCEKG
jgi:hypothetical protein